MMQNDILDNTEEQMQLEASNNADGDSDAVNKIKQRREARRRKILENAKLRLDRLNGRVNTNDYEQLKVQESNAHVHNTNQEYSDPEVEPDQMESGHQLRNAPIENAGNLMNFESFFTNIENNAGNQETAGVTGIKHSKYYFIIQYRLHVILSIIISYALAILELMNANVYSIFIPTGMCIAFELFAYRKQKQMSTLVSLVIALCGLRTQRVNTIYQVVSIIQDLFTDLALTIFLISLMTFVLKVMNNNFEKLMLLK